MIRRRGLGSKYYVAVERTLKTLRRLLAQLQNAHATGKVKGAHEDVVVTTAKTKTFQLKRQRNHLLRNANETVDVNAATP